MSNQLPVGQRYPVFLATAFDKTAPVSDAMTVLETNPSMLVLHPLFNWAAPKRGKEVLDFFGESLASLPSSLNRWAQMIERDYWSISKSSVLVYDVDRSPGEQFLAVAVIYRKPIILVSKDFAALPFAHFSGFVRVAVKPEDLVAAVQMVAEPMVSALHTKIESAGDYSSPAEL